MKLCTSYEQWHRKLRVAVATSDRSTLMELTEMVFNGDGNSKSECANVPSRTEALELLNHPLSDGRTLLHVAVEFQAEPEVLFTLLQCGCSPSIRDTQNQTPYSLAEEMNQSGVLKLFRKFRAKYPQKFDYTDSDIPLNEPKESEASKQKKKEQKERHLAKKQAEAQRLADLEEQDRFDRLSDREKRALAAEHRVAVTRVQQQSQDAVNAIGIRRFVFLCIFLGLFLNHGLQLFSRYRLCDNCSVDITGKVPFHYSEFHFCSSSCLSKHRTRNVALSNKKR
ncbi:Ankyrin repeat and zinc finger domain-containing protein 1 [Cichlidogyrus casuarinus]|uniref:Ankyrin repeat and zinc finger domain-containing protein 1 n=1 Tax=Cichlidogyrus casuarinus TaxID=1844966 RepID=A0ABD2PY90_9PLAT